MLTRTRDKIKSKPLDNKVFFGAVRAAGPVGLSTMLDDQLQDHLETWWDSGIRGSPRDDTRIANPLFSTSFSANEELSWTSHPILGYHLAAAEACVGTKTSLKTSASKDKAGRFYEFVDAARAQFNEWVQPFMSIPRGQWTIAFAAAESLALCHTLQHFNSTGQLCANLYQRQLSPNRLVLDERHQEARLSGKFDSIETSDLWDECGGFNVLISAGPLLKRVPWAAIHTSTIDYHPHVAESEVDKLFGIPLKTVSTLLGISPQEYWTNITTKPTVDEYLLSALAACKSWQEPGVQWRLSWKLNSDLSGRPSDARLRLEPDEVALLFINLYENIQTGRRTNLNQEKRSQFTLQKSYHVTGLVAFLQRLAQVSEFDCAAVCRAILEKRREPELVLEFSRQGLYSQSSSTEQYGAVQDGLNLFSKWPEIPEIVYVTLTVPNQFRKSAEGLMSGASNIFQVEGYVKAPSGETETSQAFFSDVQVVFGSADSTGEPNSPDHSVVVAKDNAGWAGQSDMIATFPVLAATLFKDLNHIRVGIRFKSCEWGMGTHKNTGDVPQIWETGIHDTNNVYLTRFSPGHDGHPFYNSLLPGSSPMPEAEDVRSHFKIELDSGSRINSITGHLDIFSAKGKKLLAEKANVQVQQVSPFVFEVSLGNREVAYLVHFPVPVTKNGSKTRIARTSSYVEIGAPLAEIATDAVMDDFAVLSTLAEAGSGTLTTKLKQSIPVSLNISYLNLDALPVIDVSNKEGLRFLSTLISSTFSTRERKLREEFMESGPSGLTPSPRMNFKESIFTMFMLASGLQGGQTGLFSINHPDKGGIHMLIFVSALRLDAENASVLLDAAVIPFTKEIISSGELESFLLILRTLEIGTITVDDDELVLWKKALPALAERCRTWCHAPECEYAQPAQSIPLSTEPGHRVLCSCGEGKLAEGFVNLPEWQTAARYATRVAISPIFATPLVEEVVDATAARGLVEGLLAPSSEGEAAPQRCWTCGRTETPGGADLKKCTRCRKARYCSAECQKKDWKKHRMECEEAAEV